MAWEWNKPKTKGWRARAVHYANSTRTVSSWVPCDRKGAKPEVLKAWLASKDREKSYGTHGEQDPSVTFGQLIERWEAAGCMADYAPSDRSGREARLRWWVENFGAAKYHQTPAVWINETLRKDFKTAATRNRYRSVLGAVIRWCVREGYITVNILRGQKEDEKPKGGDRYHDHEIVALWDAVNDPDADPRLAPMVALGISTGGRQGELWALRWSDIRDGWVHFEHDTKRDQKRRVPLQPWVADVLRDYRAQWQGREVDPHAPMFEGKMFATQTWPRESFNAAVDKAGLGDRPKPFHDLRHTFVTRLLEAGIEVQWVSKFTGHTTAWVLNKYAHIADEAMQAFVEDVEPLTAKEKLEAATGVPSP